MFKYTNTYVHRFEPPKTLFAGCNNHLIWHGWCAWTSLCLVASPASLSSAATQIFLLPWHSTSSSPKWDAAYFLYHPVIIVTFVVPLSTAVWKLFLAVLLLTKNGNRICGKAFCRVCKLQWGSKISSFCCLDLEVHDCDILTSPPISPVVVHSPFLSPFRELPLGKDSSSICSSKVSVISNMLLSNIYSYGKSALAKYFMRPHW